MDDSIVKRSSYQGMSRNPLGRILLILRHPLCFNINVSISVVSVLYVIESNVKLNENVSKQNATKTISLMRRILN